MARSFLSALLLVGAVASPLWDYVHTDDGAFSWYDTGVVIESTFDNVTKSGGWRGYLLNVTSQKWLTPADFAGPYGHVWTHQVLVIIPEVLNYPDAAAMWITGNDNDGTPNSAPDPTDEDVLVCASLAVTVGTVCSVLWQIPNAPIVFTSDPERKGRSEDAAVAWTWRQFMLNHPTQPEWVLYFPMAKAGIKAMDATTAFVANKTKQTIGRWVTAGASKRGATTWLTGAVDKRIIGIVPIVFDALNFKATVDNMWRTLGNWTFAFTDYRDANVTKYLNDGSNYMDILASAIDPLVYKENLTMSKLVVDSTGDEFFQVQDDSTWWGQLPGESLRVMMDNAEHSCATGALYLITAAETWYRALLDSSPRPSFNWTMDAGTGAITIKVYGPMQPVSVVNRMTTTLDGYRRDFRLVSGDTPANPCTVGIPIPLFGKACLKPIIWIGNTVGATSYDPVAQVGTYVLTQDVPAVGWRAWLGELYFNSTIPGLDFQLTTQVSILPAAGTPLFPFPLCVGDACIGDLV